MSGRREPWISGCVGGTSHFTGLQGSSCRFSTSDYSFTARTFRDAFIWPNCFSKQLSWAQTEDTSLSNTRKARGQTRKFLEGIFSRRREERWSRRSLTWPPLKNIQSQMRGGDGWMGSKRRFSEDFLQLSLKACAVWPDDKLAAARLNLQQIYCFLPPLLGFSEGEVWRLTVPFCTSALQVNHNEVELPCGSSLTWFHSDRMRGWGPHKLKSGVTRGSSSPPTWAFSLIQMFKSLHGFLCD